MALGYEPSLEELTNAMNPMQPPEQNETTASAIAVHTDILIDLLKTVTRIEAKIDADSEEDKEEVKMEDFRDVPAFSVNTNPITDAILMSNPNQS